MPKRITRRTTMALAGAQTLLLAQPALAAIPTPRQTPGPFYPPPRMRPADTDWDLVRVAGRVEAAGGEILHLKGRVLGRDGAALSGALVEIWQCDVNGRYHHDRDTGEGRPRDDDFQGFGAVLTDDTGAYRFRTIKPVAYPGRTPHIHARVVPVGGPELITQLYLADHPLNDRDFIYRSLGEAGQKAVTITPVPLAGVGYQADFDFVL